jgi:hypothetical protein
MHTTHFPRPDTHALDESQAAPGPSIPTEPPITMEVPGAAFSPTVRSITHWLALFCATMAFLYWAAPSDADRHFVLLLVVVVFVVVLGYALVLAAYVVGRFVDFLFEDVSEDEVINH